MIIVVLVAIVSGFLPKSYTPNDFGRFEYNVTENRLIYLKEKNA